MLNLVSLTLYPTPFMIIYIYILFSFFFLFNNIIICRKRTGDEQLDSEYKLKLSNISITLVDLRLHFTLANFYACHNSHLDKACTSHSAHIYYRTYIGTGRAFAHLTHIDRFV